MENVGDKGLRNLIDKIAVEQGFQKYNIEIKPITSGGANYTTLLYVITISGDKDDLKLFAKVANFPLKLRESIPIRFYEIELFFYTKLLNMYRQIEDRHNLPAAHRLNTPEYYGCNPNFLEETIVLDDLVHRGYMVYDRFKSIDWTYASKAVEELAKFHALSHALSKEDQEIFDVAVNFFKTDMDMSNEQQKVLIEKNVKSAISVAKDEHKEKIVQFMRNSGPGSINEYFTPLGNPVLVHGDYRVSNQLYTNEDGSLNIKTVDFQTMKASSSVLDLLYLIFTGTDEEFRREHYQALIDHYYEQLCAALRRLDIVPDDVYTRKQYDYELRERLPYGLIIAIILLPIITVEAENAPNIGEAAADLSNFSIKNNAELYPERMRGVISDFVKMGVL